MLTWNVTYHCKAGQRQAFYDAITALGMRALSVTEEGNLKYDYYFSAQDENELLLVESWTEKALQDKHCSTDTFRRLQELKAQYCESVSIDKFED
ncbi:MAG: antibiotic biosynthesis monooxygenase [Oscillibacter sp.]|nr:antibiotic biosynthesis monooxygenase [Oscillibacter sp.]